MSVSKAGLISALSAKIPKDIITNLLDEYEHLKHQFFLGKYRPSELNGGRFGECVVRLLEYLNSGIYTAFGTSLGNSDVVLNRIRQDMSQPDAIRFLITSLTRIILDVRNKRDVAHVGGQVSPNYSDSNLLVHCADWIVIELVRQYHNCSIDAARKIVANINEIRIPIVAEVSGFVRVQNTKLNTKESTLVILYYKQPDKVSDNDLLKWTKYGNSSRYKASILLKLDAEAFIHYEAGYCTLLPKGAAYVEKNIPLDLLL